MWLASFPAFTGTADEAADILQERIGEDVDLELEIGEDVGVTETDEADAPIIRMVSMLIVEAHRGLTEEQSAELDAALVLVLANHIGDIEVLHEAIALAKRRVLDAAVQQQQQQQAKASLGN